MTKTDAQMLLVDALDANRVPFPVESLQLCGMRQNFMRLSAGPETEFDLGNADVYDTPEAIAAYKNALSWLFTTMGENEIEVRGNAIAMLKLCDGQKVLVTGCGIGTDAELCTAAVGAAGVVHAQDFSDTFVEYAANATTADNLVFTVSNALDLPYRDDYFDAVMHFGGINFFGDMPKALLEMSRVCKPGGRILFGDESLAQHLRETEFGKMVVENSHTWAAPLPLEALPECAGDIEIRYVMANCFYLIAFTKMDGPPKINIDVVHKGFRGGTMRSRYFGQVEGIDVDLKAQLYTYAKKNGVSVSAVLSDWVREKLKD